MIEEVDITTIRENPVNPRTISKSQFDLLRKSVREFPEMLKLRPIVVKDNIVQGGNMRLKACIAEGHKTAWIIRADNLTDAQVKEFLIKDNVAYGAWNYDMLANNYDYGKLLNWGLSIPGLETKKELSEDAFKMAEKTDIKEGDMFQIGAHRLLCGDCTDAANLNKLMGDKRADLVFIDPPYNIAYEGVIGNRTRVIANGNNKGGRQWEQIDNDEKTPEQMIEFLTSGFKNIHSSSKDTSALYIFYASKNHIQFETAVINSGFEVKQQIIWNKGMVLSRSDYHYSHEPLLYCVKKGQTRTWYGNRENKTVLLPKADLSKLSKVELLRILQYVKDESTIWDISKYLDNPSNQITQYQHPNQKPVALAGRAIANHTLPGEIVLDTFAGSGSTMSSCEQLNRICYSMELSHKFAQTIINRMKKLSPNIEITKL